MEEEEGLMVFESAQAAAAAAAATHSIWAAEPTILSSPI